MPDKLSPDSFEQWRKVEEKVRKAEIAQRQAVDASRKLYEATGLTKTEREQIDKKRF